MYSVDKVSSPLISPLLKSNTLYYVAVAAMKENHDVMVPGQLFMAGDVELNPGPYKPGMLVVL